jgi:carbonic anhydrase
MKDIARFIAGFERFQDKYFGLNRELFDQLGRAQRPRAMVIACCDSRVDPAILTGAEPGEMFVVRNVANLVPPYEPGGNFASVPAALEFAVLSLEVEHIIVLGHAQCGGIKALMSDAEPGGKPPGGEFIGKWVSIAQRARERVLAELPSKPSALQERACEQAAILVSLENLMTYPWIARRVEAGALHLHGWYFDIGQGELFGYSPLGSAFEPLVPLSGRVR